MQEWSYLRGGLSTIDRDYGIFNKIHHDIGTHVLHHLFPQVRTFPCLSLMIDASKALTVYALFYMSFLSLSSVPCHSNVKDSVIQIQDWLL